MSPRIQVRRLVQRNVSDIVRSRFFGGVDERVILIGNHVPRFGQRHPDVEPLSLQGHLPLTAAGCDCSDPQQCEGANASKTAVLRSE